MLMTDCIDHKSATSRADRVHMRGLRILDGSLGMSRAGG